MTVDIRVIRAGQMYRYYLRETVVGDGRRPARTPLREVQEEAGVPAGRWMGRGLAMLGLTAGQEVTEAQLRNLFGGTPVPQLRRSGPGSPPWPMSPWRPSTSPRRCS
ncbi:relaxase domain-containing protein [Streptomyces puniciscabiei]